MRKGRREGGREGGSEERKEGGREGGRGGRGREKRGDDKRAVGRKLILLHKKTRKDLNAVYFHLLLRIVSGTMSRTAAGPLTRPAAARGLGRWPDLFT